MRWVYVVFNHAGDAIAEGEDWMDAFTSEHKKAGNTILVMRLHKGQKAPTKLKLTEHQEAIVATPVSPPPKEKTR